MNRAASAALGSPGSTHRTAPAAPVLPTPPPPPPPARLSPRPQRLGLQDELSKLSVVHVAGTKGKGSTSAMVESLLRRCGYRTGLYTSPHLIDVRERIRIDGLVGAGLAGGCSMGAAVGGAAVPRWPVVVEEGHQWSDGGQCTAA